MNMEGNMNADFMTEFCVKDNPANPVAGWFAEDRSQFLPVDYLVSLRCFLRRNDMNKGKLLSGALVMLVIASLMHVYNSPSEGPWSAGSVVLFWIGLAQEN